MVTNGGKPPRCGDDAPSVMALENRGPCAHRGGGVGPGSEVGFADVCAMPLVRSTVYEMLRMRRRCSWAARARTSSCAPTTPPRATCCGATSCWPSGTRSRPEEFVPERSVGGARRGGGRVAVATTKHRPSQHCPGRNTMGLTTTLSNG